MALQFLKLPVRKLFSCVSGIDITLGSAEPTHMTDAWEEIKSFKDELSAEVLAGELRGGGVPAEVVNHSHLPGLEKSIVVRVPASLTHRARWVMKSLKPKSAELIYEATGELRGKE